MSLSRRSLLTASALALAGSRVSWSAAGATAAGATAASGAATAAAASSTTGAAGAAAADATGKAGPIILCWNENPYGPSPAARAVLSQAIPAACRYPDDEVDALVKLLSQKEGLSADHIVTGTGSGELLRALGLMCGRESGELITADPTYLELPDYASRVGATVKTVAVDKALRHDLNAMHAAVTDRTRAIYICNPNNPTGTVVGASAIASFVNALPDHVTTIVDEAYMDFAGGQDVRSVASLTSGSKRVVVLRTFSKIHGMAGVRCGYAIARPDVAKQLADMRMTSPNVFAVRAARASLGDHAFLTDTRRRIVSSRTRITTELAQLGMAYAEPQGNFVFFDTGKPLAQFTEFMRKRNILVGRRFPPFENWCRITIGTEPEVDAFLQGLRAFAGARSSAA
ncbi:MAG TPA: histidinol-phosphate transaminase [Steroidobacteraceae bacterium]|nr:histidinol-phosphate transaminase [Steroidobacteraceae bacterium]